MTKKLIILALIFSLCVLVFAASVDPVPKCSDCGLKLIDGDYMAPVLRKSEPLRYVHFKCALKKHLRAYRK